VSRSPATVEHRQGWHGVYREPGDHLGLVRPHGNGWIIDRCIIQRLPQR
jgi:hypothetical protein